MAAAAAESYVNSVLFFRLSYKKLGYVLLQLTLGWHTWFSYIMAAMRITNSTNLTGGSCPPILGGCDFCTPLFFNFGPGGNALKLPTVVHILLTGNARLEIFRIKAYFGFRFRVRQFPFNPGYLTSVSASKSRDIKIFPFKTNSA